MTAHTVISGTDMLRRSFCTCAPLALAAVASPEIAKSETTTPISALYRKWLNARDVFNAHPTGEGPDADVIWRELLALEDKLLELPVVGPCDFALKIQVATDLRGHEIPEAIKVEAEMLASLAMGSAAA